MLEAEAKERQGTWKDINQKIDGSHEGQALDHAAKFSGRMGGQGTYYECDNWLWRWFMEAESPPCLTKENAE